jgi:hypothetical protein
LDCRRLGKRAAIQFDAFQGVGRRGGDGFGCLAVLNGIPYDRRSARINRANTALCSHAERRLSRPNWQVPAQASSPAPPGDGTWRRFQFPGRGRSRGIARHQQRQYQRIAALWSLRDYQTSSPRAKPRLAATGEFGAPSPSISTAPTQTKTAAVLIIPKRRAATTQFRLRESDLIVDNDKATHALGDISCTLQEPD